MNLEATKFESQSLSAALIVNDIENWLDINYEPTSVRTMPSEIIEEDEDEVSVYFSTLKNIEDLSYLYDFNNSPDVIEFLSSHNNLIEILFRAHERIKEVFGDEVIGMCLEHDIDPEEDFEGLSAIIKTNLSPELSLDLLDKFDEEWWLDIEPEIRMLLCITVIAL